MQLKFANLKGMEVLADKEGRLLGPVRRLHIDSKRKSALGLVFKARGISGEQWAQVSKIDRIGEDVIVLPDAKSVRDDQPQGRDVKDMLGLSVTSLDGKRLGALQDVVIDTESWSVIALALDNGGEVAVGSDSVFGEDTVLLQKGAADQVKPGRRSQHSGFLARVFSSEDEEATVEIEVIREPKKPAKRKTKKKKKKSKRK
jgi:sporulation protein YlmC with PRC-barrel domain